MPLNALLVRSPLLVGAAGRMGLLQPARFRVVKRVRKFDAGLLRRCYGSSANNTTDQRRVQSDMPKLVVDSSKSSAAYIAEKSEPSTGGSSGSGKICPPTAPVTPPRPCGAYGGSGSSGPGAGTTNNDDSKRNLYLLIAAAGAILGGSLAYYAWQNAGKRKNDSAGTCIVADGKRADPTACRVPANPVDIPKHVPYLLIGGGTASFAAFRAIKSANPKAKVLVVTDETEMPYMRPPLSKEMWTSAGDAVPVGTDGRSSTFNFKQWNGKERSLFFEPSDFYLDPTKLMETANGGVAIVRGYTVRHIDVCTRTAVLTDGTEIKYDECLLATGSHPRNLDVFAAAPTKVKERIALFKTVRDYERLRHAVAGSKSVAVIGGGFLGSELSCALAKSGRERGLQVYQVFRESGNIGHVLPRYLSEWTANRVREEGVKVVAGTQVEEVRMQGDQVRLRLMNGRDLLVDRVVVAVGSEPDTQLAQNSGLEVDGALGGFVVNAELEARRHLYVAGDAACFYDTKLGRRRVEHHDHAVVSGRLAGENMVGQKKPYKHQSMFWSDIGPKVGFEAIGIVDASLPTVGVFAKASAKDTPVAAAANNLTTTVPDAKPINATAALKAAQAKEAEKSPAKAQEEKEPACACDDVTGGEQQQYGKGVVFYLRDEKVVGVLLWNVFNRINTARAIVNEHKKWDDLNELAKLFEIHS